MATLIKTIYDDAQHTNEIAPRTKFSAVSDDDGAILGDVASFTSTNVLSGANPIEVELQPKIFIDTNRILTSQYTNSDINYTATEDCVAFIRCRLGANASLGSMLDGVKLSAYSSWEMGNIVMQLKKSQTLSLIGTRDGTSANSSLKVFGLKK